MNEVKTLYGPQTGSVERFIRLHDGVIKSSKLLSQLITEYLQETDEERKGVLLEQMSAEIYNKEK